MAKFSANLGFLWTERPLPSAIRAAAGAGFDAVECHWPFAESIAAVAEALAETGLPLLSLNTVRGDAAAGEFGLAALPGRENEARAAIDQAVAYARDTGCRQIHVMAGRASGVEALAAYSANLGYACEAAAVHGIGVLIEPLNPRDVPGYFLHGVEQAADLIAKLGRPNLKLLFDAYHVQISQGDLTRRLEVHLPLIGHVQIAAVPSRHEPDEGEVAFDRLLQTLDALGYTGYVGAEYRPRADTATGLGWLAAFKRALGRSTVA
ncbi:MAG: hydroxypyruvate isomerase family protein [Candidatus Competibacterales bacterium]